MGASTARRPHPARIASLRASEVPAAEPSHGRRRLNTRVRTWRLAILLALVFAVLGSFGAVLFHQNQVLAARQAEKEDVLHKLESVLGEQQQLRQQVKRLNDDDYIAKLARRDYFLSKKGEVIFTLPTEAGKAKGGQ